LNSKKLTSPTKKPAATHIRKNVGDSARGDWRTTLAKGGKIRPTNIPNAIIDMNRFWKTLRCTGFPEPDRFWVSGENIAYSD
jgi:hypothetical protein